MSISHGELEEAIEAFWKANADAGTVRAGKQFDSLVNLLARSFLDAGYPPHEVHTTLKDGISLPGYFRAHKRWDLVVSYDSCLVAAIECKSINLKSLSNNFNNRLEEALGTATDLRRAAQAGQYPGITPWLGYFLLMEDGPASKRPVQIDSIGSGIVQAKWKGSSYQKRAQLLCEQLLSEGLYDAVCFVTSSPSRRGVHEAGSPISWAQFCRSIGKRVESLKEIGIPGNETIF